MRCGRWPSFETPAFAGSTRMRSVGSQLWSRSRSRRPAPRAEAAALGQRVFDEQHLADGLRRDEAGEAAGGVDDADGGRGLLLQEPERLVEAVPDFDRRDLL